MTEGKEKSSKIVLLNSSLKFPTIQPSSSKQKAAQSALRNTKRMTKLRLFLVTFGITFTQNVFRVDERKEPMSPMQEGN